MVRAKIMKLRLNLSKLCRENYGLFFSRTRCIADNSLMPVISFN